MKNTFVFILVLFSMSFAILACGSSTPATSTSQAEAEASIEPSQEAATQTSIPTISPSPTIAKLQLEIVQSQTWTDRDGNARVNVLLRNPNDFPIAPTFRANAELLDSAGKIVSLQELYFLDGISGGNGFLLPGETIAANACFNCEEAPLTKAWESLQFEYVIEDASSSWDYYTAVEATVSDVSFEGDSPIFWVTGTVKNNTDSVLSRISARVFVFDQEGNLVGAAEVSSWDVGQGASANFSGYGIGLSPDGAVKYEVSALGVKY